MPDVSALGSRPHTFSNGTVADATQVNANASFWEGKIAELITAINDLDNANIASGATIAGSKLEVAARPSTILGKWDLVKEVHIPAANAIDLNNAQHYMLSDASSPVPNGTGGSPALWYPDSANFAVSGLTPELHLVLFIQTNATAPAVTFTLGLHHVTAAGGGADVHTTTINTTPVTGSTVALASPVANGTHHATSGGFAIPSTGATTAYAFGLAVNGSQANNSSVRFGARLEVHWE
jgi:hypothetical protein